MPKKTQPIPQGELEAMAEDANINVMQQLPQESTTKWMFGPEAESKHRRILIEKFALRLATMPMRSFGDDPEKDELEYVSRILDISEKFADEVERRSNS